MKFVRYGSLNLHHNAISDAGEDFHRPPVMRGVYAFPLHHVEFYLVTWKYTMPDGWSIDKKAMNADRKTFEYSGPVWHHLGWSFGSLQQVGSWTLDYMAVYKKKLKKRLNCERFARSRGRHKTDQDDLEVFISRKVS